MNGINPFANPIKNKPIIDFTIPETRQVNIDNIFINNSDAKNVNSFSEQKVEFEGNKRLIESLLKLDPENKKLNNARNELELLLQGISLDKSISA